MWCFAFVSNWKLLLITTFRVINSITLIWLHDVLSKKLQSENSGRGFKKELCWDAQKCSVRNFRAFCTPHFPHPHSHAEDTGALHKGVFTASVNRKFETVFKTRTNIYHVLHDHRITELFTLEKTFMAIKSNLWLFNILSTRTWH